jgi:hypothetical protein
MTISLHARAALSSVILRSRALARRLEGWRRTPALVVHPSRLAVKNGEHLQRERYALIARMTG